MRSRSLLSVLLVAAAPAIAVAATAGDARAAPPEQRPPTSEESDEAAKLKADADEAMTKLRYADALTGYARAYELAHDPALLYNKGRALEALGRYPESLDQLVAFDQQAPPGLKARVPALRELIADMRAKVTTIRITCRITGARVVINDRIVGTLPLRGPLRANAGTATVQVEAEGYFPFRKTVNLPGGGEIALDAALQPKGGMEDLQGGERTSIVGRWWFWAGVGALVIGGAVLTGALLTERSPSRGDIEPGQVSAPIRF